MDPVSLHVGMWGGGHSDSLHYSFLIDLISELDALNYFFQLHLHKNPFGAEGGHTDAPPPPLTSGPTVDEGGDGWITPSPFPDDPAQKPNQWKNQIRIDLAA